MKYIGIKQIESIQNFPFNSIYLINISLKKGIIVTYKGWSEKKVTDCSIWKLHIVEKFWFPRVQTDGTTWHTAGVRVNSGSSQMAQNDYRNQYGTSWRNDTKWLTGNFA